MEAAGITKQLSPTAMLRLFAHLRRACVHAVDHDCFNIAQATAYSAIVGLFPALIVAAALIAFVPDSLGVRYQLTVFFDRILPSNVSPLLQSYFASRHPTPHSKHVLITAAIVSVTGAAGVISTFMEGFRRAYSLPLNDWGFWHKRAISFALVPLSLMPLGIASVLVVFGHVITNWMVLHITHDLRRSVLIIAWLIRWTVALTGSVGLLALIYQIGTPLRQSWRRSLPGAALATGLWFLSTLGFGTYVSRFANYAQVYGSLGAGIALLVWLYIVALSVLIGAEFNAQLFSKRHGQRA